MEENQIQFITYADILKNAKPRKRYHSECAQKTWFDQVVEFERHELTMRSISLSHITKYDEVSSTMHTKPQTNSCESLKMSSDFDSCIDTSSEGNDFKRRSSFDSHRTTSSSGCSLTMDSKSRTESSSSSDGHRQLFETDEAVLARRQKQIDYGKRTNSYECYRKRVPRMERKFDDPRTPNKHFKYSRRAFDGMIKAWRKQLHHYDPSEPAEAMDTEEQME